MLKIIIQTHCMFTICQGPQPQQVGTIIIPHVTDKETEA